MDWFQKLRDFVTAAEQKAKDAAKMGADFLRSWADWLEATAEGRASTAPLDGTLVNRLTALGSCDDKEIARVAQIASACVHSM